MIANSAADAAEFQNKTSAANSSRRRRGHHRVYRIRTSSTPSRCRAPWFYDKGKRRTDRANKGPIHRRAPDLHNQIEAQAHRDFRLVNKSSSSPTSPASTTRRKCERAMALDDLMADTSLTARTSTCRDCAGHTIDDRETGGASTPDIRRGHCGRRRRHRFPKSPRRTRRTEQLECSGDVTVGYRGRCQGCWREPVAAG